MLLEEVYECLKVRMKCLSMYGLISSLSFASVRPESKAHRQKLSSASINCQTALLPQDAVYVYHFL